MSNQQLTVALQAKELQRNDNPCGPGNPDDPRVSLELGQDNKQDETVDLVDLKRMWTLAQAGKSARTYNPYNSDIRLTETTISFSVDFYVAPLPMGLDYSLSTTLGSITGGVITARDRNVTKIFDLSRCVDLEKAVTKIYRYEWLTPLIDKSGAIHTPLPIRYASGRLIIDEPYFGVARINFGEVTHRYSVRASLPLVDEEGRKLLIDDINITITAVYIDEEGESQTKTLTLTIPKAVESALKLCSARPDMICHDCPSQLRVDVYYSSCDGSILDVHRVDPAEGDTWCLPAGSSRWGTL